jgi:hypothetical protein
VTRRRANAVTDYPALARLVGAYLHEDRDAEDASDVAAARRFAREVAPAVRRAARRDITRLLAASRTDRALDAVLRDLGAAGRPERGLGPWLRDLAAALES